MGAQELIACFADTLELCQQDNLREETARSAASGRVYQEGFRSSRLFAMWDTMVEVTEEDSLDAAKKMAGDRPIVAMMHYPPLLPEHKAGGTGFTQLLSAYGVSVCVYGHLHGHSVQRGVRGLYEGVQYHLASCDALDFKLLDITPEDTADA